MQSTTPGRMIVPDNASPLQLWLAQRIRVEGALTFAEYMRECLYHPEFGYYSRAENLRFADFYTSVDVHPIFGRLLARQMEQMWRLAGRPPEFVVVEAAAGTGRLASHILDFSARELPDFYSAMRYVAVEISAARRARHARMLVDHMCAGRATSAAHVPSDIPVGCILSNELIDALPVHRVAVQQGRILESYVTVRDGSLVEKFDKPSTPEIVSYCDAQGIVLVEGQQAEVGLEACRWIQEAGRRLGRGFVITVDYGHEAKELYNEQHMRGTLLAYRDHRVSEEFLQAPGQEDLTAHVNFTALELWGRRAGLLPTGCVSQMDFLLAMGRANGFADLYEANSSEVERTRSRLLLKTLIHPEGMGETFRVFIQHKGVQEACKRNDSAESAPPQLTGLMGI